MSDIERENILKRYTTPGDPIAFSARSKLRNELKINQKKLNEDVLSHNYSYALHRAFKKPKHYNPYLNIHSPRDQIQCDLIDMIRLKHYNSHFQYLLVFIDVFSRDRKSVV